MVRMKDETEKAYPRQSTEDKDGEYRYLYTECGNFWYSVNTDPMRRDNCICSKCGRIVKVVIWRTVVLYDEVVCNSYGIDMYGENITPYYADLEGKAVRKTPITNPYDFDDYVEWKGNYRKFDSAVYSDRLYQWDTSKYKKCYEQVFKNDGQRFNSKNVSGIRKFLSMYFDKEIELTAIMQGCNHISGFPYWIFFYRELES